MVSFYKHDIPAWRGGTGSLTFEQYRVYHIVIEQIMLEEGPIVPHERTLAGLANTHWRTFRYALDDLLKLGKLRKLEDGRIMNGRAFAELARIACNRHAGSLGGSKSAQTRRIGVAEREESMRMAGAEQAQSVENANKINGTDEAPLHSPLKHKEKTREEKIKEKILKEKSQEKNRDGYVWIANNTPQWDAWYDHYRHTGQRMPPTGRAGVALLPAEWPPNHQNTGNPEQNSRNQEQSQ